MTTQAEKDALLASIAKAASSAGSQLSNLGQAKKRAEALVVDDAPPPPDPTPDPTPTPPPPEPQPDGSGYRPTEADVGPQGDLQPWTGSLTLSTDGQVIEGVDFRGPLRVEAAGVTLRNCRWTGAVWLGSGGYLLERCETTGNNNFNAAYRDMRGVTINRHRARIQASDGFDFFSTAKGHIYDVEIDGLLLDGMNFDPASNAHGDGIQLRGVTGFTLRNFVIDIGPAQPQKNAAFYAENVEGGLHNLLLEDGDLIGGGPYGHTLYTALVDNGVANRVAIKSGGFVSTAKPSGWTFTDVTGPNGAPITAN